MFFKIITENIIKNASNYGIQILNYGSFDTNATENPLYLLGGNILDKKDLLDKMISRAQNVAPYRLRNENVLRFSPDYVVSYLYNGKPHKLIMEFDEDDSFHQDIGDKNYLAKCVIYDDILRTTNTPIHLDDNQILDRIYSIQNYRFTDGNDIEVDYDVLNIPTRVLSKYHTKTDEFLDAVRINGMESALHTKQKNSEINAIISNIMFELLRNPKGLNTNWNSVNLFRIKYPINFSKGFSNISSKTELEDFIYDMNSLIIYVMQNAKYIPTIFLSRAYNKKLQNSIEVNYSLSYPMYQMDLSYIYDKFSNDSDEHYFKNNEEVQADSDYDYKTKHIDIKPIHNLHNIST